MLPLESPLSTQRRRSSCCIIGAQESYPALPAMHGCGYAESDAERRVCYVEPIAAPL
jgi:hypothetical protein